MESLWRGHRVDDLHVLGVEVNDAEVGFDTCLVSLSHGSLSVVQCLLCAHCRGDTSTPPSRARMNADSRCGVTDLGRTTTPRLTCHEMRMVATDSLCFSATCLSLGSWWSGESGVSMLWL